MSKQKKSKKPAERDLFTSVLLFTFGLAYSAGSLLVAVKAYDSVCESDSTWIFLSIGALSLVIFVWGLVLIAAGLFPGNPRLQAIVEKVDGTQGSNEFGCLLVVLAIPVYLLAKLLRGLSSRDSDS
jgi:hypothetical protein